MAITYDLVEETLSRLPVKSVLRFKCVSKSWYSLISSPHFVKSHMVQSSNKNSWLLLFGSCKMSLFNKLKLKHPDISDSVPIVSICDGLIAFMFSRSYKDTKYLVIVCNPCTGESRQFSRPDVPIPISDSSYFNPLFGFGYDLSTHDYKLLLLLHLHHPGNTYWAIVFVLSLTSDTNWRLVNTNRQCIDGIHFKSGLYVNGALHWTRDYRTPSGQMLKVVAFNLADEKFSDLPGLEIKTNGDYFEYRLSAYKDCICLYKHCRSEIDGSIESISLWIMREYGNPTSWTHQRFIISSLHVSRNFVIPHFQTDFRIWFYKDNANSNSNFVLYDLEKRHVTDIQIFNNFKLKRQRLMCREAVKTYLFHETLVSPYPGNKPVDEATCSYVEELFSSCDAYTNIIVL